MSAFSDMLKNYVHAKDINVSSLASYCETDRSTVYKFIMGKREPASMELVEKIAYFMKLTPFESNQLRETWKMARLGEENYYIRKSITHFLSDFPNKSPLPRATSALFHEKNVSDKTGMLSLFDTSSAEIMPSLSEKCFFLNSRQAVDFSVHQILLAEADKPNGKLALFLQSDYPFLFQLLSSIHPAGSLQVDHIFSLNRTAQFTGTHELYEFYYLRNIFPVYMNHLDYRPYCFYTNELPTAQTLSAFPYLILTSEYAITCSSDYQMGFLFHDGDILLSLWNQFRSKQSLCQVVFQSFPLATDNLPALLQYTDHSRSSVGTNVFLQPEACILSSLTGDLVKDLFNHELPGADQLIPLVEALVQNNRKLTDEGNFILYFTEQGMARFLRYGLLEEFPSVLYHPLNLKQRLFVLRDIAGYCRSGAYRLLKEPLNHLPENIRMALSETVCTFTYQTNSGEHMCLSITEPFILQILYDFLNDMDPDLYYTPEETAQIIERQISQLESQLEHT